MNSIRASCLLTAFLLLSGCEDASRPTLPHSFEDKAKATLASRANEYSASRDQIFARINAAMNAGHFDEARKDIQRYAQVAQGELEPLAKRTDIQETVAKLAATSKEQPADRLDLLSRLAQLEPSNTKWSTESAAAKRAMQEQSNASFRAQIADSRRAGTAELERKRSQGVSIGMSMQDVLQSSWGRPERIAKTTTARGVREQWAYDGKYLYFEDGILVAMQH